MSTCGEYYGQFHWSKTSIQTSRTCLLTLIVVVSGGFSAQTARVKRTQLLPSSTSGNSGSTLRERGHPTEMKPKSTWLAVDGVDGGPKQISVLVFCNNTTLVITSYCPMYHAILKKNIIWKYQQKKEKNPYSLYSWMNVLIRRLFVFVFFYQSGFLLWQIPKWLRSFRKHLKASAALVGT